MIPAQTMVLIESIVLTPDQRLASLPMETRLTPLKMWVKGTLLHEAMLGDSVSIKTATNRVVCGILKEVEPHYTHSFGQFVPELLTVRTMIEDILHEDKSNE
jgi:hypothetical protein